MVSRTRFDWDEYNTSHIARHGVSPEDVEWVLHDDPIAIGEGERNRERRWVKLGETSDGRLLVVVYTIRRGRTRVVTAHPANRAQRTIWGSTGGSQMPGRNHWSECATEAEEARWWDENTGYITEMLRGAAKSGKLIRGKRSITVKDEVPVFIPPQVDVSAIRERIGLSQGAFARRYGFTVRTVQDWEQGRRCPDSAARAYLLVIERNPKAVEKALRRSA